MSLARSRRRSLHKTSRGEVAAFDVVLFVPLLIVATLFLYAMLSINPVVTERNFGGTSYAADALQSFLSATAPNATLCVGGTAPSPASDPCHAFNTGWRTGNVSDYTMAQLVALHLSLIESVTGASTRAALVRLLDTPGWAGYVINNTASQVAMGSSVSLYPQTYPEFYLEFENSTTPSVPCSLIAGCVYYGFSTTGTSGTIYSASAMLLGASSNASPISIVLGVWS